MNQEENVSSVDFINNQQTNQNEVTVNEPIEEKKKLPVWLRLVLTVLAIGAISIGIYFILDALNITNVNELREIIKSTGGWGWAVFLILQILVSTLLCFIPGSSAVFVSVSVVLFGPYKGLAISALGVFLSSMIMFWIGNVFGEKLAKKLVGEENLKKAQDLIDMKSKMLLPMMFVFPIFPDDALCMVAGMTKMKAWYFALIVAIFRTIGVATICLGAGLIDWSSLTFIEYFLVVNVLAIDLFLIFTYQHKLEKWIKKTILRKKYALVKKDYMVEEEVIENKDKK